MALATLIISIGALIVAALTAAYNKRNAVAAEDSAVSSARSADAAKDSAESARSSAQSAAVVARAEVEREHRDLRPTEPTMPAAIWFGQNPRTGREQRFLEFTLPRTYRATGDAVRGASRSPVSVPLVAEGGRQIRVYLDSAKESRVEAVHLRFWPPVAGDPGETWQCDCGRPGTDAGDAHWSWFIEIPPPKAPMVVYSA